jgi:hypothetical protein
MNEFPLGTVRQNLLKLSTPGVFGFLTEKVAAVISSFVTGRISVKQEEFDSIFTDAVSKLVLKSS